MYTNFGIKFKFIKIIQKEKKRSARKSFRIIITWMCVNIQAYCTSKQCCHLQGSFQCKPCSFNNTSTKT